MSRNGNKLSVKHRQPAEMTEQQRERLYAALEKAVRGFCGELGPARTDRKTYDFVFHMTDWYGDLIRLAELYQNPSAHSQTEWNDALLGFLYHVPGHLNAAATLSDTLLDPFKVLPANRAAKKSRRTSTRKRVAAS